MSDPKKAITTFDVNSISAPKRQPSALANLTSGQQTKQNAALQALSGGQESRKIQITYGLDFTDSTTEAVTAFKRHVQQIYAVVAEKSQSPTQYFGLFDGRKQVISQLNDSTFYRDKSNIGGENRVAEFICKALLNSRDSESAVIIIIFADGLESRDNSVATAVKQLKDNNAHLFFVYQATPGGQGNSQRIKQELIDPLGEKGVLIDIAEVSRLVELISNMVGYVAKKVKKGSTPQSFADFLKMQGGDNSQLKITQGQLPRLGSGS